MNRSIYAVALCLPLALLAQESPSPNGTGTPDERFQQLASTYIEAELASNPEEATELGDHRFDDVLTDYSHTARDKILAAQKQFKIEAETIDAAKLSQANSVDLRILKESIDKRI